MDAAPLELTTATGIVVLLLGLSGYFGRRQWQILRRLPRQADVGPEDRAYHRAQAWRRLSGCALMVACAGMVAGWYLLGLNRQVEELREQGRQAAANAELTGKFDAEQQHHINVFSTYWIVATLLLLALIAVAFADVWAIRRFGLRQLRRLQSDRRAALEREVAIYRSQRNGHGTSD